jgi:hypothetical protein
MPWGLHPMPVASIGWYLLAENDRVAIRQESLPGQGGMQHLSTHSLSQQIV